MSEPSINYSYDFVKMTTTGEFSHRISVSIKYGSSGDSDTIFQVFKGFRLYDLEKLKALQWLEENQIEYMEHRVANYSTEFCFKTLEEALLFRMTR